MSGVGEGGVVPVPVGGDVLPVHLGVRYPASQLEGLLFIGNTNKFEM